MRESGARRGRGGRERSAPCSFCRQSREDLLSAGQWVMRAARRAGGRPGGGNGAQDFCADGRWRIPTGDLGRDPWDSGQKSLQLSPKCGARPRVGRWPYRRSEPWSHGVHMLGNKLHVPRGVRPEGHTDHRLRRRDVSRLPAASQ